MKALLGRDIGGWRFDPDNRQVRMLGVSLRVEDILLITELDHNNIIYNFSDSSKGGVFDELTQILTLDTNVSQLTTATRLQIWVEVDSDYHLEQIQQKLPSIPGCNWDSLAITPGDDGPTEVLYKLGGVTQVSVSFTYLNGELIGVARTQVAAVPARVLPSGEQAPAPETTNYMADGYCSGYVEIFVAV